MEFNTSHRDFSWPMEVLCCLSGNEIRLADLAADFNVPQKQIRDWIDQLPARLKEFGIIITSLGASHTKDDHGFIIKVEMRYRRKIEREALEYYEKVYGPRRGRGRPKKEPLNDTVAA